MLNIINAGIPHKAVGPHMKTVDLITAVSNTGAVILLILKLQIRLKLK